MYINHSIPVMAWPQVRKEGKPFEFEVWDAPPTQTANRRMVAHIRVLPLHRHGDWHPSGLTLEATSRSFAVMVTGTIPDLDRDDSLVVQLFLLEVGRLVGIIEERRRLDGPTITYRKG